MQKLALALAVPAALVALIAFAPTPAVARLQGGGGAPPAGQGGAAAPAGLGATMEEMKSTLSALQKAVETKDGLAAALPDVAKLQKLVIEAKETLPRSLEALTDPKAKHKALLSYKTKMQELVRATLDLELAMLNDDAKGAGKALRAMESVESAGHGEFRPKGGRW